MTADLIHETTTGTGAGNLTLTTVRLSFNSAFGTGATTNVFEYYISNRATVGQYERGRGHMTTASLMVRDTILAPNFGTAVSFTAGTKDVMNAVPADVLDNHNSNLTNRLVNGEGQIWQTLNTVASSVTDVTYCWDQWYALTQTVSLTASQQTNLENGTPFAMRLSQASATSQRFGLAQIIEGKDCIDLRGKVVSLSARARMSTTSGLRYAVLEHTGAMDAAIIKDVVNSWTSATYTAGNFFTSTMGVAGVGTTAMVSTVLTNVWVRASVSAVATNLYAFFWTDAALGQNVTLDIAKAQLEIGSVPTPYSRIPVAVDYSRCCRFFQKSWLLGTPIRADSADGGAGLTFIILGSDSIPISQFYGNVSLPVATRITPTVTIYPYAGASTSSGTVSDTAGNTLVANSGTPAWQTEHGFVVYNTGVSTSTLGKGVMFHYTADARF